MGPVDLSSSSATLKCDFDQSIPLSKEGSEWESNLPRVIQPCRAGMCPAGSSQRQLEVIRLAWPGNESWLEGVRLAEPAGDWRRKAKTAGTKKLCLEDNSLSTTP